MSWEAMENRTRRTGILTELAVQQHTTGLSVTTGLPIYNPPNFNPLLLSDGTYLILSDGTPLELT